MSGNSEKETILDNLVASVKKKSFYYSTKFMNIDKYVDVPKMTQDDLKKYSLSMTVVNSEDVVAKKYSDVCVRCYSKETKEQVKLIWKYVIANCSPRPQTVMLTVKGNSDEFIELAEAVREAGAKLIVFNRENPLNEAAKIICTEYIDTIIGDSRYLNALGQYCAKNEVKNYIFQIIGLETTQNKAILRQISRNWNKKIIRIKYIPECFIPLAIYKEKEGYEVFPDYHIEISAPDNNEKVPDGEYGMLCITTLNDTCQPLIQYNTGIFTRIIRSTGLLDPESRMYGDDSMIEEIIYRYDGVITHKREGGRVEIVSLKPLDEYKIAYELSKINNDKIIVKYIDNTKI